MVKSILVGVSAVAVGAAVGVVVATLRRKKPLAIA
jgi:hypothetical protein